MAPALDSIAAPVRALVRRYRAQLTIAFYVLVFSLCGLTIIGQLRTTGFSGVAHAISLLGYNAIALSALCVIGVYGVMCFLEHFALQDVGVEQRDSSIWSVGLLANAVSMGTGFGALSGAGVRMRLYTQWNIPIADSAWVALGVTLMSITGGVFVAACGLAFAPHTIDVPIPFAPNVLRVLGVAMLACFALAFALFVVSPERRSLVRRIIRAPNLLGLTNRVAAGAVDWLFSAAALYVLFPHHNVHGPLVDFFVFAAAFTTVHLIAMASGLPGGIGVFDALMLSLNPAGVAPEQMVAALLVYRLLSFVAPTVLGALGLAIVEARTQRRGRFDASNRLAHWAGRQWIRRYWPTQAETNPTEPIAELFNRRAPRHRAALNALTGGGPIVVLAPHPDDETLGCGGLLAASASAKIEAHVVLLTAGGRSHLGSRTWSHRAIAARRTRETHQALRRLGHTAASVTILDLSDGALLFTRSEQARAARALSRVVRKHRAKRLFATWLHDPHPDHLAAAFIADRVAHTVPGLKLFYYPIWGRFLPDGVKVDRRWRPIHLDITAHLPAKRAAIALHRTQTTSLISDAHTAHRLTPHQAREFLSPFEVFFRA